MKKECILVFKLFILLLCISDKALALTCSGSPTEYTVNSFVAGKDAIELILPSSVLNCSGDIGTQYNDALRVYSVTLNSKLVDAGFTDTKLNISYFGDFIYPFSSALYKCVWYDSSCSVSSDKNVNRTANTATFKPTLKRSAGIWPKLSIRNGEELLSIRLEQRSKGSWSGGINALIIYKLNGEVTTPDYTCDINTYDSTVKLPTAQAGAIRIQSAGRVISSKKRFNDIPFNLK